MPEFDRECGSQRVFHLIEFLHSAGWAVSFVAESAPDVDRYERLLQQRGIATYKGLGSRVDQLIALGDFDVAIVVFWYLAEILIPRIRQRSPRTRIVVDSIDIQFVRESRRAFQCAGSSKAPAMLGASYGFDIVREINAYAAADGVLTVSDKEKGLINDLLGRADAAHCVSLADSVARSPVPVEQRKGILFIGNFRHPPNVDAVEYLCRDVLSLVNPDVYEKHPVYIVGNGLDDTICKLGASLPFVHMVGWVPSLLPYLHRTRITVVPLRYGAGMKGKLIQALMAGTPTVTSTIGIEGMMLQHLEHAIVADCAEDFACGMEQLLTDTELWQALAVDGHARAAHAHSLDTVASQFADAVSAVLAGSGREGIDYRPDRMCAG